MTKGPSKPRKTSTPYTGIIKKYLNEASDNDNEHAEATFTTVQTDRLIRPSRDLLLDSTEDSPTSQCPRLIRLSLALPLLLSLRFIHQALLRLGEEFTRLDRPDFVLTHPYVTSSYYTAASTHTLAKIEIQTRRDRTEGSRLAVVRPFCEFDSDELPSTFECWNGMVPCRAASGDLGKEEWEVFDAVNGNGTEWECEEDDSWVRRGSNRRCRRTKTRASFDDVGDGLGKTSADLFLFYSQTYSESPLAVRAVDQIMDVFFSPGGWSLCFDNVYAIEANIPPELDLYIPSAQDELYNWVNGPNRQFEAAFRIIQSGEWGNYDGFYLMEGDSVPVKHYWLDVILSEIDEHRPFAVLGAQYDGDKWDSFYELIPISLIHHTNGNGIYNTSHPLLERIVGQLEVEASCPYNSIPYDYRMSQMWVEGTFGIVPKLAPKIMLNEEGENITLSDNTAMLTKWANRWKEEEPYKYTKAISNYAATNIIPRHLGPEYVIHGAKLYSPWDPTKIKITLVVSEWLFDRSLNLIKSLDYRDHPFDRIIIMIPPSISNDHDYTLYTRVPVTLQFRDAPDFLDLCAAEVETEWFMVTNSYHLVARHVDLMFTQRHFIPVIPYTPATYPFCLKYPYCKEMLSLSQRWNPKHNQVVQDMDMLYHTKERNEFCDEWRDRNGDNGEDLYAKHEPLRFKLRGAMITGPKGPTAADYFAFLTREKKDGMYKMTDRSFHGARASFVKVYRKEEILDGLSEDELVRRMGMTMLPNVTECSCKRFDTDEECAGSELGCQWRPLFESCYPPERIDDEDPICAATDAPTMSPSISIDQFLFDTESPTTDEVEPITDGISATENDVQGNDPLGLLSSLFKSREHDPNNDESSLSELEELLSAGENRKIMALTEAEIISKDGALAANISSDNFTNMCPTWGPSIVPRRSKDFSPTDDFIYGRGDNVTPSWSANFTKSHLIGRSLHIQHQLVHLERRRRVNHLWLELPPSEDVESRRLTIAFDKKRRPLRIHFDTSSISTLLNEMEHNSAETVQHNSTHVKIQALVDEVFPSVSNFWGELLTIQNSIENIIPNVLVCGTSLIPENDLTEGIPDTDVVIYVAAREQSSCAVDDKPIVSVCHFDQNMRPLVGSLSICLDEIDLRDDKVYDEELLRQIATTTNLVGKFLGLEPSLFQFFRNDFGIPWGGRLLDVSCDNEGEHKIFLSNIIQQQTATDGDVYYEISTPTVRQVVRNHFDCQSMTGARLNPPIPDSEENCVFSSLDLRYHFDEDMTSLSHNADAAFAISPLSLALLEDSSWYKANFTSATTPSFGRAAGCGFIYEQCISKGRIPDYSTGYFCNTSDDTRKGCDFTHRNKAGCDTNRYVKPPPKFQYFTPSNPDSGSPYDDVYHCPMRSKHLSSCSSKTRISTLFLGEFFDDSSRCYETDAGTPVCLETICNSNDMSLSFLVQGKSFPCKYHGEVINVGLGYSVKCPRIAAVCPDLVCPSNCSGRGICDYCREVPLCICVDPSDESPGCWDN